MACFCTSRWSLVALGVPEPELELEPFDPLWPMFPIFKAWPPAARGDVRAARAALGDFSVLDIVEATGTEGTRRRRRGLRRRRHHGAAVLDLRAAAPATRAATSLVAGCASYHAAVDHHLGALAASLGDMSAAEAHFRAAVALHERLGAAGWARLSQQALADLSATAPDTTDNEFRLRQRHLAPRVPGNPGPAARRQGSAGPRDPDRAQGSDVHVFTLLGMPRHPGGCRSGARRHGEEPVQGPAPRPRRPDRGRRRTAARPRPRPSARRACSLIHELAAATGLGGRSRRLGDPAERARKTVSARVRDALSKIDQVHPQLARHLRDTVHLGTHCGYATRPRSVDGHHARSPLGTRDRIRRRSAQTEADGLRVDVGSSVLTTILGSACLRSSVTTR